MNEQLIKFRHRLHKYPEISNQEYKTSEMIYDFVNQFNPDEVIRLGKTGLAFVFNGTQEGETVLFSFLQHPKNFSLQFDRVPLAGHPSLRVYFLYVSTPVMCMLFHTYYA